MKPAVPTSAPVSVSKGLAAPVAGMPAPTRASPSRRSPRSTLTSCRGRKLHRTRGFSAHGGWRTVLGADGQALEGDLYAKVVKREAEKGSAPLRFTSVPPAVKKYFKKLRAAAGR